MSKWRDALEDPTSRHGRAVALSVQFLILVSMISFAAETLPRLGTNTRASLHKLEIAIVGLFTLEYVARVLAARRKRAFIFGFYGLVDLLAILPFYFGSGIDLRSIRVVRILRVFRVLKLTRYNKAVQRLHKAFAVAKEELVLFFTTAAVVLYLSAVGIYYFERTAQPDKFSSIFASLWWAIVTFTTVGYGDTYPVTVGGRLFTSVVLIVGLGIVAIPTGIIASALARARELESDERHPRTNG
jgi:voltage-gated potassium channel